MGRPGFLKRIKNFFRDIPKNIKKVLNSDTGKQILNIVNTTSKLLKPIGDAVEMVAPGQYKMIGTGIKGVAGAIDNMIDDDTKTINLTKENITDGISNLKILNPKRYKNNKDGK